MASVAAADPRRCVARIGPVPGAIDPEWTLVSCLLRYAKARSGPGRSHRYVGRHRHDRRAIRGILTLGILADDTLRRLGPIRFLPELRNLAPEQRQSMKVLVTGASGYIGRQLADKLSAAGHGVTCMVRNAARSPQLHSPQIKFVEADALRAEVQRLQNFAALDQWQSRQIAVLQDEKVENKVVDAGGVAVRLERGISLVSTSAISKL